MAMPDGRNSGLLLHPTSLPGGQGIGDLGEGAREFVEFLRDSGQAYWQILPLGPVGPSNSPYSSYSSFAGNPLLISLNQLQADGLISADSIPGDAPQGGNIDFDRVRAAKLPVIEAAFSAHPEVTKSPEFIEFCEAESYWLQPYSLWQACRERFETTRWKDWPRDIAMADPEAINRLTPELQSRIDFHDFTQFLFNRQWNRLREQANAAGIHIVGDIPFYADYESADVWAAQDCFLLNRDSLEPEFVAGVPPDCFSHTGQLWGNPIFNWGHLFENGFSWWVSRFRRLLSLVDIVRIDHFRGFQAFWQVPASHTTAMHGEWIEGPGTALFHSIREQLGELPVWAEDLGMITADVDGLRRSLGFPGMKVLQFAFDGDPAKNPHRPEQHEPNSVVYTGTHDNNTTRGWWGELDESRRASIAEVAGAIDDGDVVVALIRVAMHSSSQSCIIPLQDVLNLDGSARMNVPGLADGNWGWRCPPNSLTDKTATRLKHMTELGNRL